MLVSLSLSKFGLNRKDAEEAKQVAARHGGDEASFAVTKRLLAGNAAYDLIRKYDSGLGAYNRKHTLPWDDAGTRLLPTLQYDEYMTYMRAARAERDNLVRSFLSGYDAFVQADRTALGTAFNPDDYPDRFLVRDKFEMKLDVSPVPDGKDFRVTVSKEDLIELQQNVAARISNAEEIARRDLMARLAEPLQKMASTLGDPDKKLTLNVTVPLVENLREILDLLPKLNVLDDPRIEKFRLAAQKSVAHYEPESLKNSQVVRTVVASKAQEIVDAMADFMGAPVVPAEAA